ncbi:MAG: hypothetical protein IT541_17620, partial [Hyphomicrobiales bacterium]|nr:hypothetical protein [Hyphomicrobiales bacterium]
LGWQERLYASPERVRYVEEVLGHGPQQSISEHRLKEVLGRALTPFVEFGAEKDEPHEVSSLSYARKFTYRNWIIAYSIDATRFPHLLAATEEMASLRQQEAAEIRQFLAAR